MHMSLYVSVWVWVCLYLCMIIFTPSYVCRFVPVSRKLISVESLVHCQNSSIYFFLFVKKIILKAINHKLKMIIKIWKSQIRSSTFQNKNPMNNIQNSWIFLKISWQRNSWFQQWTVTGQLTTGQPVEWRSEIYNNNSEQGHTIQRNAHFFYKNY